MSSLFTVGNELYLNKTGSRLPITIKLWEYKSMAHKNYTPKFQAKSDIFYRDMTVSRFQRYVGIFMIS